MAANNITGFEIGGQVRRVDYNHLANLPFLPFTFTTGTPVALAENVSVERVVSVPEFLPGSVGRDAVEEVAEEPPGDGQEWAVVESGGIEPKEGAVEEEGIIDPSATTVPFSIADSNVQDDPLRYLKVICDGKEFILCSDTVIESTIPKMGDPVTTVFFSARAKECPVWVEGVLEANGALCSGTVTIHYFAVGDTEESDEPITVSVYALMNASFSMPRICSFDRAFVAELAVQNRVNAPEVTCENVSSVNVSSEKVITAKLFTDRVVFPIYEYDYQTGENVIMSYRRLVLNSDGSVTCEECNSDGEVITQQEI